MEFEWKNIPRIHNIRHSRRDSKNMTELQCELEQFLEGSSSCQCETTLCGETEETQKIVRKSVTVANYGRRFLLGRLVIFGT